MMWKTGTRLRRSRPHSALVYLYLFVERASTSNNYKQKGLVSYKQTLTKENQAIVWFVYPRERYIRKRVYARLLAGVLRSTGIHGRRWSCWIGIQVDIRLLIIWASNCSRSRGDVVGIVKARGKTIVGTNAVRNSNSRCTRCIIVGFWGGRSSLLWSKLDSKGGARSKSWGNYNRIQTPARGLYVNRLPCLYTIW